MSTSIDPHAFMAAHAAGLKNQELARKFRVHVSTVKRLKRSLHLGNNDPRNATGRLGEQLVAQQLATQGFSVTVMPEGHPFDLMVTGQRLEVKTSTTATGGAYRFRLHERRSSNHAAYRYDKAHQRDADLLALVIMQDGTLHYLYLLPIALWQPNVTVRPASPFCPYAPYQNAIHLLTAHRAA